MSIELDRPGGGVAAFMLSLSTLLALEKNGTLADDELADIVEQSLARLKTIDAETSVRSQAAWGSALDLLEQLHARLARDRSRRQLDYLELLSSHAACEHDILRGSGEAIKQAFLIRCARSAKRATKSSRCTDRH